jgi:hypothetical protein
VAVTVTPYGFPPALNWMGSVYPGGTMIAPQCIIVTYSEMSVVSWPPCAFIALVIPLTALFDSAPFCHSGPSVSMNARSWLADTPYRVGALNRYAFAHSMSSGVASGT